MVTYECYDSDSITCPRYLTGHYYDWTVIWYIWNFPDITCILMTLDYEWEWMNLFPIQQITGHIQLTYD